MPVWPSCPIVAMIFRMLSLSIEPQWIEGSEGRFISEGMSHN